MKKSQHLINRKSPVKAARLHSETKTDLYGKYTNSELEFADEIDFFPPAKPSEDPNAQYTGKLKRNRI